MPTDYSNRPSNQQLIGMTPSEILGIFGGAGKEYEKYIPQYNRERENLARTDTQFSLRNIGIGSQQAQAKSGFAGSGAIGQFAGRAREGTLQGFQKQLEGFRSQYASDVYGALGTLAGLEVFKNKGRTGSSLPSSPVSGFGGGTGSSSGGSFGQGDLYGDDRLPQSEQGDVPISTTPTPAPTQQPWEQYNMTESDYNDWMNETGGNLVSLGNYGGSTGG